MEFKSALVLSITLCASLSMGNDFDYGKGFLNAYGENGRYYHDGFYNNENGLLGGVINANRGLFRENIYGGYGFPRGAYYDNIDVRPRLANGNFLHGVLPNKDSVNVNVDVKRDPAYAILHHDVHIPKKEVKEKAKLPAVTLRERETIIANGERQRNHHILPVHKGAAFENFGVGY